MDGSRHCSFQARHRAGLFLGPVAGVYDETHTARGIGSVPLLPDWRDVMAEKPSVAADSYRKAHQRDVVNRLRRVEGQIRGVVGMIEKDSSCDAVAQQLSAARKALDKAFYEMLACSLESELVDADPATTHEVISETTRLLAKYA